MTPEFIICPVCNSKILFCENLQCDDCIHGNHETCGFTRCNCFKNDIILELYAQVIQLKIENSKLVTSLCHIDECDHNFKNREKIL